MDASAPSGGILLPNLLTLCREAQGAADDVFAAARRRVTDMCSENGKVSGPLVDANQVAAHGLSWLATYVEGLRQMLGWAERLEGASTFGEMEQLMVQAAFGEYLAQIKGGIALSQVEIVRPADMGLTADDMSPLETAAVKTLIAGGNTPALRARMGEIMAEGHFGALGLDDEMLDMVRDQFHKFVEDQVMPHAHEWHLADNLIPIEIVDQMAELGVFGLTVPEEGGGLGMGKIAMCVVTEELSRGYIGVGSLGTRSEIAAELIRLGGTPEQQAHYLPKIASGEILPTAVFTEPGTGSDLASLKTRAVKDGDTYKVTGNKTWITHASRSDLMTLLVRTNPDEPGYKGLSMLLAEKPRGTEDDPFPAPGMSGGEIEVLGYRGMKEYELGFDGFEVPAGQLLGGQEGQGFKQLMATFESARIQTAARAVGVAQNAMELGLQYALERNQFGRAIHAFPRVHGKLAWMAVETMIARQLTYFAAREKDSDRRCDIEAGMAKLLGARTAWSNADNALQIHGGNGYAMEYPISRVLCDARILNILEGAAEIQAQVIARGLMSGRN
ncbi:acyl-CoA/acyl-ACP dehydrogenase [bacterium SCSIO 12827]|nr:acyl-CoA/acyl-ACP dehydrogenase [bacterium SCSIO 12827]